MAKLTNEIELNEPVKTITIREAGELTERVKQALLSTVADAKDNPIGDVILNAHHSLLPDLFEGWMASDQCATLRPDLRASFFRQYHELLKFLEDIDEVIDRLPIDILKSNAA